MLCNFRISVSDARYEDGLANHQIDHDKVTHIYKEGLIVVDLDFVPQVGMHFGPCQLLTVCQIYSLGNNRFEVTLRSEQCADTRFYEKEEIHRHFKDLDELIATIVKTFPCDDRWQWTLIEQEKED